MIRFSVIEDRKSLFKLWNNVFEDSFEAISLFFDYHYKPENTVVYDDNGYIAAMLYLIEGNFVISGKRYPSYYLYAAATDMAYRSRGIMGKMLDFAKETASGRRMDFICLLPAEKSLYGYYSKFGYKPVFSKKIVKIGLGNSGVEIHSDNNLNLADIRNRFFDGYDYFEWNKNAVEYAIKQNEFYGGSFMSGCNGYCLYTRNNGITTVKELTLQIDELPFENENCVLNLPVNYPVEAEDCQVLKNGMALPLNKNAESIINSVNNAYLGLTLD